MRKRRTLSIWVIIAGVLAVRAVLAADQPHTSRHVVVIVWDGMRPDFVTEENTPTLCKLAREGVVFKNHHAVYPSATHVNGVAMMTGLYPDHNGLIANYDYRPEIDPKNFISTEKFEVVRKGDEISGGKYLRAPTLPELVRAAGGRTAIAGAKTVTFLLDRKVDRSDSGNVLFAGESLPRNVVGTISAALGPFPPPPQFREQDAWTTKALTEFLWKDGVPVFSMLWLGEPDLTEHQTAPGAPPVLEALKSADGDVAQVLSTLDRKGVRDATDVFVVSDHGFSTIERSIDLKKILNDAGFNAATALTNELKLGDIMLVGNGGTILCYVIGHDPGVTNRLVEFLQRSDFAAVIFTKAGLEGTFPFDRAMIETPNGPDVQVALRWNDSKNQFGVAGMIDGDWNRQAGKGTHATLSRFDMHNTLIVAGPDFRRGENSDLPSGNVDLAPTILNILGIKAPPMDGRILSEAMTKNEKAEKPSSATTTTEATSTLPGGRWRQTLQRSQVGSTVYLDEGNGGFTPGK
jgi:arylsulfatase A-like enzyme